jgi:hypothetical protein
MRAIKGCGIFFIFGLVAAQLWAQFGSPSFLSATSGVPLAATAVLLPEVDTARVLSTLGQGMNRASPWRPSTERIIEGELIIETEAQMRDVWARVFTQPYDATLFDFNDDFVVWMGGGLQAAGVAFSISTVEWVEATYDNPGFLGGVTSVDPLLSTTSTLVLPGVMPIDPPPPTFRVSAVRVSKSLQDHMVFHRGLVALP